MHRPEQVFGWSVILASVAAYPGGLHAQSCLLLSSEARSLVVKQITADQRIASVTRVGNELANKECYRRFTPERYLHISQGQRYVFPASLDLTDAPPLEPQRAAKETESELLADKSPTIGAKDAPLTIVVFFDFQCPACRSVAEVFEQEVFSKQKGSVRIVYKHFPLQKHAWAMPAAEAAVCASLQKADAFWTVHDFVLGHQDQLTEMNFQQEMDSLLSQHPKLNAKKFASCVQHGTARRTVLRDIELGRRLGVTVTPTLFVNGAKLDLTSTAQLRALIQKGPQQRSAESSGRSKAPATVESAKPH